MRVRKPVEEKPLILSSAVPLALVALVPPKATVTGAVIEQVPVVVMTPPESPDPQVTDVTVPDPAVGVTQVPSPRRKVDDEAPVPLLKRFTETVPVRFDASSPVAK